MSESVRYIYLLSSLISSLNLSRMARFGAGALVRLY